MDHKYVLLIFPLIWRAVQLTLFAPHAGPDLCTRGVGVSPGDLLCENLRAGVSTAYVR